MRSFLFVVGGDVLEDSKYRLISRDYILVIMSAMGTSFVNYFFFSSLSLFSEKLTGTVAFAGLLSLAYSAPALIIRPVSGIVSDRFGRVKFIVIGSALCVTACLLYSFTTVLVLLILIRVLNGIGMSMNTTSAGAAVPDIVPKERMAEGVGLFGLYATVAQAVGPFIALAIVGDGELSSFNKLFYVSAAVCAVSMVCGCFIRYERVGKQGRVAGRLRAAGARGARGAGAVVGREAAGGSGAAAGGAGGAELIVDRRAALAMTEDAGDADGAELIVGRRAALAMTEDAGGAGGSDEIVGRRAALAMTETDNGPTEGKILFGFDVRVFGPSLVLLLYFFGISSVLSYLTLYGKTRGFHVEDMGWFFLASAGGLLLARLVIGRIVDRRGGDLVMIPGLIVTIAALFAIPFAPSLPHLICLALPYGIATGAVVPTINAVMFKRCSPKRRGTVSAAYFASIDIGITLGAPVMGWIADRAGFSWVYWLSATVVGLAALIFIFFVSDRHFSRRLAK